MIICCMNPLLSRLSTSVGQRTFLGGCLSFLAFFMAMPRLTIPYTGKYAPRQKQAFEFGCADGASQG